MEYRLAIIVTLILIVAVVMGSRYMEFRETLARIEADRCPCSPAKEPPFGKVDGLEVDGRVYFCDGPDKNNPACLDGINHYGETTCVGPSCQEKP